MSTNVIFRKCENVKPCVQFYSMPESIVGGADTVAEASERFEAALTDCAGEGATGIVEHTEIEAVPQVFVRMRLGSDADARVEGLNEVTNILRRSDPIDIAHLGENQAASGDVVIVIAQPHDTIGSILDQMTPFDSLWLAMNADGGRSIDFFNIRGARASGEQDVDATPIDPVETRDVTLQEFLGARSGVSKQMVLA